MSFSACLRSLAARFLQRTRTAAELEEELRSHIQHRADDLERSGLQRAEAERRARIEFGAYERYRQESHEALAGNSLDILLQDLRFSLRVLRKSPGFVVVAVLTLALAIGANAVVFAVLNALVLRPLNVPQSGTLYGLEHGDDYGYQSYLNYLDLRDRNRSFNGLAAYTMTAAILDTGKNPAQAWVTEASGNYFDVLGIQPYLGRFFHHSDEHGSNSAPYIVLSHAYWHSHFHDDSDVIGRSVLINKHPLTIIGVAPPSFQGTLLFFSPDLFVPMVNQPQVGGWDGLSERSNLWVFEVLGHLKPGVTPAQAASDLNAVGAYLEKTYPGEVRHKSFSLVHPALFGSFLERPVDAFMAGLMLLVGLILLAACANLGSLFAAHAADRSHEVALRLALGSTRRRILRQLLTEAALISIAGGALGLLAAVILLRRLSEWRPFPRLPVHVPAHPDAKVYLVALLLALVSGLLFGLVPVRQVFRTNPYEIVKANALTFGSRLALRDILLVVQISICAVLVTASLVAVRGLMRSLHANFGFDPENATLAEIDMSMAGYTDDQVPVMQKRMIQAMETIPGVEHAAIINVPPLAMGNERKGVFKDDTRDLRASNAAAQAFMYPITPGYFETARTTLLAGRSFTWHDDKNSPRVAVVNREFARAILGSASAGIGRYFRLADGTRIQVVGIVEDGKYLNLTEDPQPAMFFPILQQPWGQTTLVVRSTGNPAEAAQAMRSKLRELDPGLPADIEPWNSALDYILFAPRMATLSLGVLGIMGAVLSVTGIFGMASYSVSRRLRELGIRIALGAQRTEVLQAALGRAVKMLALGSAAGLILGILASRVLASIVYEATPRDPLVLAAVVFTMMLLGIVATLIPARRALSLDPLVLLREG